MSEAGLIKLIGITFRELPLIRNLIPRGTTDDKSDTAGAKAPGKRKKK